MAALLNWLRLNWILPALVVSLVLIYLFLGNSPTEGIDSLPALDQALSSGKPVVLEFYSNFWSACLLAKPVVDGMEEKLVDKAEVIRLDVLSKVGRQAAARYGVRGIPTFVVVDGSGQAVYQQAGFPSTQRIIEQVNSMPTSLQLE